MIQQNNHDYAVLGALSRTTTKLRATVIIKRLEEGIMEARIDKLEED